MLLLYPWRPAEVATRPPTPELLGKAMITAVAVAAPVGAVAAELAAVSVWQRWGRRVLTPRRLRWAVLTAAMYRVSQSLAVLFPHTALADGQHESRTIISVPVNQLTAQALVLLPMLAAGRYLAATTNRSSQPSTEQEPSWRS